MAECIVLKGGGGADLDVVTAGKPDVLAGKVIVDKDGEPLTGTMPNRGDVSQALNAGGSYTIPAGYHNGSGKVTANSLASQTPGNASTGQILTGYNGWVNGQKVNGSIPIQGADEAADRAWATNWATWDGGEIFLGVRNGYYLNGVNWIRYNLTNFVAANIKKGVNIGGKVGTFEGYVPTATDLYLRGNNIRGWHSGTAIFDSGQITIAGRPCYLFADNLNFAGYNWLNIEGYANSGAGVLKDMRLWPLVNGQYSNVIGYLDLRNYDAGHYIYGFDLTSHQIAGTMRLELGYMDGAIYRIWLT